MNILADFHHQSLFHSLQLLFENRLGHNLFRPIGMEWFDEGYWKLNDLKDTAIQYLRVEQGYEPPDGTLPLNEVNHGIEGIYVCEDLHNNSRNKAITLDKFKEMPIDIVIASIPQHIKPYKELAKMKNAKFIFQMGNMFTEVLNNLHEIPNLLASTIEIPVPQNCNGVFYHQEFDLDVFKPSFMTPEPLITSFINVYHENVGFEDYINLMTALPDFEFRSYGGQCKDGSVASVEDMADIMQRSFFGFHSKRMGDGFGHVLYNWYACGKPVITRISDYVDKLGGELLEDDETCIDLDKYDLNGVSSIIREMSPEKYSYMCQQAYQRFKDKVDYDQEKVKIRKFLEVLN